jgi:hypothetical protein
VKIKGMTVCMYLMVTIAYGWVIDGTARGVLTIIRSVQRCCITISTSKQKVRSLV